jgi:5-formyltetrahydrofolate cyclo-ligase
MNTTFQNPDGIEVPSNKIDVVLFRFWLSIRDIAWVMAKGFTINFLSECKPDVIKIGLSFFEPEENCEDVFFEGDIQLIIA